MNDEKAWWQSRTIIGIVVMLLAQVLKWLNVDIVNEELTDIVTIAMETAGAGLAVYGRVKARKTLRRTRPGGLFNPNAEVRRAKPVRNKIMGLFFAMIACSYVSSVNKLGIFNLLYFSLCFYDKQEFRAASSGNIQIVVC